MLQREVADRLTAVAGTSEYGVLTVLVGHTARAERLLYGTDFPMLPYAWDRELRRILRAPIDDAARRALLVGNALQLFD